MRFYDLPKYYEGHAQVNTDCSSSLSTSYKVKVLKIFIISMPYKAKVMSEESFVLS